MELTAASDLARRVRTLYHQIEEHHEGSPWSAKDDMIGLVNDVGTLSRLGVLVSPTVSRSTSPMRTRASSARSKPISGPRFADFQPTDVMPPDR